MIKWWKLTGNIEKVFTNKLKGTRVWTHRRDYKEMWENVSEDVKGITKEVFIEGRGNVPEDKPT